ncbi:MAG: 30S ribosome-binding factor RbfA [Polyangiaceae bacterium]
MSTEVKRATRVASRIHEELARQIGNLRDPRVEGAIVTRVELTDDLQLARVYVRSLATLEESARRSMVKGFEAATPRLRREVTKAVSLRYSPTLRFYFDEGTDAVARVEELLHEIREERKGE